MPIGVPGTGGIPDDGSGGSGGVPVDATDVPDVPVVDTAVADTPIVDRPVVDTPVPVEAARDLPAEPPRDVSNDLGEVQDPPEPNLVGYWKFDEATGMTLRDSSGKGNDATVSNTVTWTTASASLPALKFPDRSALVLGSGSASAGAAALPATNGVQTISFWANPKSTATVQYMICLWTNGSAVALGILGGQLAAWKWLTMPLVATVPPALNAWHHIAYTYDGTTHRLYVDGTAAAMSTVTPNAATATRLEIGAYSGSALFNGQLDDLRVYNVALTAAQIAKLAAGEFNGTGP